MNIRTRAVALATAGLMAIAIAPLTAVAADATPRVDTNATVSPSKLETSSTSGFSITVTNSAIAGKTTVALLFPGDKAGKKCVITATGATVSNCSFWPAGTPGFAALKFDIAKASAKSWTLNIGPKVIKLPADPNPSAQFGIIGTGDNMPVAMGTFKLVVAPPGPVGNPTVAVKGDKITMKWTPAKASNDPITGYAGYCQGPGGKVNNKVAASATTMSIKVSEPGMYYCRVAAVAGSSRSSAELMRAHVA